MLRMVASTVGTIAAATLALTASASVTLDLGGGWEATIFDPDNVDLETDSISGDTLVLEKFANFTKIDPFTGQPAPVTIIFNQNRPDSETASRIVITEEFILNNSGVGISAFRFALLGGAATFNADLSSDFSVDPFTSFDFINGDTEAVASGGFIPDGGVWNPGATSGGLVIDVDLSGADPVKFGLKEIPVPAPGALALLGVAGLVARRRRRA